VPTRAFFLEFQQRARHSVALDDHMSIKNVSGTSGRPWKNFFADEVMRVACLACFGPPIYSLNQIRARHLALGWGIMVAWVPAQSGFIWWLHKRGVASIWLTTFFTVLVVGGFAVISGVFR
jgi:hypothetical protein